MAATLDDILGSLDRLNQAVEKLGSSQKQTAGLFRNRRLNRWNTSPRQHKLQAIKNLLKGDVSKAWKNVRGGWRSWKAQRGYGKSLGGFGNVLGAASALGAFKKAVESATDGAIAAARKYAEVSASMASVMAQRDVRELMRDREKGDRISSSARTLTNAEQDRKDNTKEIGILGERMWNYALAGGNKLVDALMTPLNEISKQINDLIDVMDKSEKKEAMDATDLLSTLANVGRERIKELADVHSKLTDEAFKRKALRPGL